MVDMADIVSEVILINFASISTPAFVHYFYVFIAMMNRLVDSYVDNT